MILFERSIRVSICNDVTKVYLDSISPFPGLLHEYANSSKWNEAVRLCRFVKVRIHVNEYRQKCHISIIYILLITNICLQHHLHPAQVYMYICIVFNVCVQFLNLNVLCMYGTCFVLIDPKCYSIVPSLLCLG